MTRTTAALAAVITASAFATGCGDDDWRESREPVYTTGYGGSAQPDIARQYDAPARVIYDPPPDLALRRDTVAEPGTPLDTTQARAAADSARAQESADTAAAQRQRPDTLRHHR